jgi:predicted nuclease of predicted toxin-antitoxin system
VKFLLDHDAPDDLAFSLEALGHDVLKLRHALPATTPDEDVLRLANEQGRILITCNRDDFLAAAREIPHQGIIILIWRRSRTLERAALVRLLETAGEVGLKNNINFA